VQAFGSSRDILVRCRRIQTQGDQIGARVLESFQIEQRVKLQRTEVVGPQVGQELFVKGAGARRHAVLHPGLRLFRSRQLALGAIFACCMIDLRGRLLCLTQMTFDLTRYPLFWRSSAIRSTTPSSCSTNPRARPNLAQAVHWQVIDESINQTLSRT